MANSDYTKRGSGTITSSATLAVPINPSALNFDILSYSSKDGTLPSVGMGLMVGNEIMRVTSVAMPQIGVARGCADTVPANHVFGDKVWFITQSIGTDSVEYMATETIGVKLLMRSNSSAMDLANSPPNALTFNRRFARPYPPGNVKVNGAPFHTQGLLLEDGEVEEFVITWAHRDRITQSDQLIGHEEGNIGPEPGTTYLLRAYSADGTLKSTISGITGTSVNYGLIQATIDLESGTTIGVKFGYLMLHSLRDGFESFQGYRIDFSVDGDDVPVGWGENWGYGWGN